MNRPRRKATRPDAGGWSPAARGNCPPRAWMEIESSLSIALARRCPPDAPFRVVLLHEGPQRPIADEAPVIASPGHERIYARDVLLLSGDTPLVYAHTVLRREHLRHPWHHLLRIGTRPLGSLLFAHPAIVPGALYYRRLDVRHPLWQRAQRASASASSLASPSSPSFLWARRALFALDGCPLLVTEVFLPGVLALPRP